MAPVATNPKAQEVSDTSSKIVDLKNGHGHAREEVFNPFYSPPADTGTDDDYEYSKYKVRTLPSISFQAFKKSSGSENAMNPYLACICDEHWWSHT